MFLLLVFENNVISILIVSLSIPANYYFVLTFGIKIRNLFTQQ